MLYNQNMFENHEYFIFHNNSVIKFSVCKVNQEIIIKSDYYEVRLDLPNAINLLETQFDTIENVYYFILNLFQMNSIMIKEILVYKSITLSFIQTGKMRELILYYNGQSKSITHYELNAEFGNLMNDIAQIKKDVQEIHHRVVNNININNFKDQDENIENKIIDFYFSSPEYEKVRNTLMENTRIMLDKQIKKQEETMDQYEKKMEKMQELAKNELKNGNKDKCKKYLILKKRTLDKIKPLEGILSLIEEQLLILDKSNQMKDIFKTIKDGMKAVEEVNNKMSSDFIEVKKIDESVKAKSKLIEEQIEQMEKGKDNLHENIIEDDKQESEDDKKLQQLKAESYKAIKEGIIANLILNRELNVEEVKNVVKSLDDIKKKQEEYEEYFKKYAEEENEDEIEDEKKFNFIN